MEDHIKQEVDSFEFLQIESVEQYFAPINISLLRGRHIQQDEFKIFSTIDQYYDHFTFYYFKLYGLQLKRGIAHQVHYFYLDFPEENKGKLYPNDLHKYLTEIQTIVTLMLLNMYYSEYFSFDKLITWDNIRDEIESGENSEYYQKLFFKKVKHGGYSDQQWSEAKKTVNNTIRSLEKLGWCEREKNIGQVVIEFKIKESINRFAEMYQSELQNFDTFSERIHKNRLNEEL